MPNSSTCVVTGIKYSNQNYPLGVLLIFMSSKVKQTALAVAGVASVFVAGSSIVNAASTYTVKEGDTLSEVANKFNMTVDDLVKSNDLKDANMIFVDQKIEVPDSADLAETDIDASTDSAANDAASLAMSQAASSAAASSAAASSSAAAASSAAASQAAADKAAASEAAQADTTAAAEPAQQAAPATSNESAAAESTPSSSNEAGGSVKAQFLANGGTEALWSSVVMPESGGNPNAVSPNGYHGLGQTKEGWGSGSVASQTSGMVNYATSRYGSVENATAFRQANGWW